MRTTILSLVGGLVACCLATQAVAQTNNDAQTEVFIKVANAGDCSGYPAMADLALSDRLDRFHGARLAVATAICAARDGRFDLTDRLIAQASLAPLSGTEVQVRFAFYDLIERLTDIPGAAPSAARAAKAMTGLDRYPDRTVESAEIGLMAKFAAGQDVEGLEHLKQIDRREALSIQTDRRFAPAWFSESQLASTLGQDRPQSSSSLGENWARELAALDQKGEAEESILAAARRQMAADIANTPSAGDFAPLAMGLTGSNGSSQRSWLVRRLLEDGRVDDALRTLDLKTIREEKKTADWLFLPGFAGVLESLIRADRSEEARRLLNWWNAAEAESKIEYGGLPREDRPFQQPVLAIEACLKGEHPARLESVEWRVALVCNDPEDRIAGLLIDALSSPTYRSKALQALNLPPRHVSLGKVDDDYRRRWNALLARPDVSAAIERYGRRLPPETAWRLSRAYPAF
jgi:hypothetical protein